MQALFFVFAAFAGAISASQAGANSMLGRTIGKLPAGLTSLAVSIVSLLMLGVFSGGLTWPGADKAGAVPWWAWLGGIMGAVMLAAQLFVAEQLGSAVFAGVFVTAALITSVLLDHFGLFGFKQHAATWARLGGLALMLAGILVVART